MKFARCDGLGSFITHTLLNPSYDKKAQPSAIRIVQRREGFITFSVKLDREITKRQRKVGPIGRDRQKRELVVPRGLYPH